jgi:hypothetical protein
MDPYLLYWMSEMEGITWDKNMEDEFWEFMLGMLQFIPKKWRKSRSSGYDNNRNSTITCFKSFPPKYHLIYKVEILKTALLNTIHIRVFF